MRKRPMKPAELKAVRLRFGLLQREFGLCIGHSANSVYQMEAGRKSIMETTQRVVEAFAMSAKFRRKVMKENDI